MAWLTPSYADSGKNRGSWKIICILTAVPLPASCRVDNILPLNHISPDVWAPEASVWCGPGGFTAARLPYHAQCSALFNGKRRCCPQPEGVLGLYQKYFLRFLTSNSPFCVPSLSPLPQLISTLKTAHPVAVPASMKLRMLYAAPLKCIFAPVCKRTSRVLCAVGSASGRQWD